MRSNNTISTDNPLQLTNQDIRFLLSIIQFLIIQLGTGGSSVKTKKRDSNVQPKTSQVNALPICANPHINEVGFMDLH